MADVSGNALEKAGGRGFLEGVKELRKAQAPLEVAAGRPLLLRLILYVNQCNWNLHLLSIHKRTKTSAMRLGQAARVSLNGPC